MGSPGTRWMSRKTTETTTQMTGSVSRMRRIGFQRAGLHAVASLALRIRALSGRSDGLDGDAADAAAGHLGDGVAAAVVLDAFAYGGDVAEVGEEESGQRLDASFAREDPVELGAEVAEGGAAVERHGSGRAEEMAARSDVELVVEFADDLLQRIFGSDEADGRAELVDDDGDLAAALLKLLQQFDGELGLGNDRELAA